MTNIITVEDLEVFADNLLQKIKTLMEEKQATTPQRKWLKSNEVRRLLAVSAGTLQTLRINGTLPFTKIGGIIFYSYEDIEYLIEQKKINGTNIPAREPKRSLKPKPLLLNKTTTKTKIA